jgi:hypothetical protein
LNPALAGNEWEHQEVIMSRKLRAVVAGCSWGINHMQGFVESEQTEFVGVWSRNEKPELSIKFGVPFYTDFNQMSSRMGHVGLSQIMQQAYFLPLVATQPQVMSKVLAIVHRVISTHLIKRAGLKVKSGAQTGAVTLIQRFGSALNLNLHYHMLYLDGVYDKKGCFYPTKSPTSQELDKVVQKIAERVSRYLEKAGYLVREPRRPLGIRIPGSVL